MNEYMHMRMMEHRTRDNVEKSQHQTLVREAQQPRDQRTRKHLPLVATLSSLIRS